MLSLLELQGQSGQLHKTGTIEINTDFHARKKPVWLVLLKLLGVVAMVAFGAAIAVPTLLEFDFPLWQAIAVTFGAMLVYIAVAFFIRPEPDTDNLGLCGGLINDPFQSADNVNRWLWKAHCLLGPGRFTAETFLDLCALAGLFGGGQPMTSAAAATGHCAEKFGGNGIDTFDARRPITPLDPNRFTQSSANFVAGQIQLDTQRFRSSSPLPPGAPPAKV